MIYDNYPFGIFNPAYLTPFDRQALEAQRRHMEQQKNIADMVKAISDYFDASRKISPDYQQQAMQACMIEIIQQIEKRNGRM